MLTYKLVSLCRQYIHDTYIRIHTYACMNVFVYVCILNMLGIHMCRYYVNILTYIRYAQRRSLHCGRTGGMWWNFEYQHMNVKVYE